MLLYKFLYGLHHQTLILIVIIKSTLSISRLITSSNNLKNIVPQLSQYIMPEVAESSTMESFVLDFTQ